MCEFLKVIEIVFNNWTSLKLSIDNGMGGDPGLVSHKLRNMVDCAHSVLAKGDFYDLVDLLEDLLDSDFDTDLQDDSAQEVATVLFELHKGWHEGRRDEVTEQVRQMNCPTSIIDERCGPAQLSSSQAVEPGGQGRRRRDPPPAPDAEDDAMGSEPSADSWTVVSRRK